MKRFIKFIFIAGFLSIIINIVGSRIYKSKEFVSPIPDAQFKKNITPSPTSLPSSGSLKTVVEDALSGTKGTYGIVVKNLKTDEAYYSNEHRVFEPGSLYKIWIMAVAFNQIQNGQLKEDEILSQDIQVLNNEFDIDPQYAELTDGTITLSVKDALEQMITISHNYAALLLTERIKLSNVSDFLTQNNFKESMLGEPPITTASDIAMFFEKLYTGELADAQNTKNMIELFKKQTFDKKLPKYLPPGVSIAHKTGEIGFLSHDAGIVFSGKGDYIIAVLSESDSPKGAEERIAQTSAAVYKYFANR